MAKTYSAFKTYLINGLWRPNDSVLSANLDTLILQADDELDKLTRDFARRQKTVVIAPEAQDYDLTTNVTDFDAVQSLTNNQTSFYRDSGPRFHQTTPGHIYELRTKQVTPSIQPYYAVTKNDGTNYLNLVGPFSASDPGSFTLVYRRTIPDYASADASWLEDEYLNLYVYSVYKHCAVFLREDDRVKEFSDLQAYAYDLANADDKHNLQFGGTPLRMRPHRVVP